jgi:hypothetical protein
MPSTYPANGHTLGYPGVQRFSGVRVLGGDEAEKTFQFGQHRLIAGYSFRKTGNPLIQGNSGYEIDENHVKTLYRPLCILQ